MSDYIKLAEAPQYVMHYPTCSTCAVDLDWDDGFMCPSCGTRWDSDAGDGDTGELYPDWAGEDLDGPVLTERQAADVASYRERLDRYERWGKDGASAIWAKPTPPRDLPAGFVL